MSKESSVCKAFTKGVSSIFVEYKSIKSIITYSKFIQYKIWYDATAI